MKVQISSSPNEIPKIFFRKSSFGRVTRTTHISDTRLAALVHHWCLHALLFAVYHHHHQNSLLGTSSTLRRHELFFILHCFLDLHFTYSKVFFNFWPTVTGIFFMLAGVKELFLEGTIIKSCNMSYVFEVLHFTKICDVLCFCYFS